MNRLIVCVYFMLMQPVQSTLASPPDNPAGNGAAEAIEAGIRAYSAGDQAKALKLWQKNADSGHVQAMMLLGGHYHAIGDHEKAFPFFEKAAKGGLALAQYNAAVHLDQGLGVARNEDKALFWYRKAAEQGLARAQNNLAAIYATGARKDIKEAVRWYQQAAKQGHTGSQLSLALFHMDGKGVMKSEAQAVRWLKMSAKGGNKQAQALLAEAYANGRLNLPRDLSKASYWEKQAKKNQR